MPFLALALLASSITSPKQQFGANLGDDYFLANYKQLTDYWTKLDKESDRMVVVPIGKTEEGRTQLMAIISDPANMRQLDKYKDIAKRLCLAKGLTDDQAKKLANDGKSIVWIDGGLHASELLGAQQLMETVYQLVSRNDEETKRILKDDIILCVQANPDGQDLCADWYMRNPDPQKRSSAGLPRLYQKYIGHDNNRDFYASTQSETTNMNRVMYKEWYPQIVYNHHQTGPAGTVLFQPPFRDPFNFNFDPLVVSQLEMVGANMMSRFIAENKPGATMRSGSNYSTWWNGGLRTTCYFHNMIGLLTETIGSPTPSRVPFIADKLLPKGDLPFPVHPREWHFRQSVDYSVTANYSVLDIASRHREQFLYNIYQMGRNNIAKGSRDSWTDTPSRIALAKEKGYDAIRAPELRDARAYIVPSDQDLPAASAFLNALLKVGVTVDVSTEAFTFGGVSYPAGTFLVRCDQSFRPHILDMFEPQDHPNDLAYPGGPPVPPYDSAGYTLAFQMGIKFIRVLEDAPVGKFKQITGDLVHIPGSVQEGIGDYATQGLPNTAYTLAAKLLQKGIPVSLSYAGLRFPQNVDKQWLSKMAADLSLEIDHAKRLADRSFPLRMPRVALWDRYGGSMPSGWIRWILEQFQIPFTVVYAPDIDAGIAGNYDVLILPSDASISSREPRETDRTTIPLELRSRLGSLSAANSIPKLKAFVEGGGTILAIGPASGIAGQLGVNVKNALVDETGKALPREKFYIPGSVMRISVDAHQPIAWGMPFESDVMFENDPVWIVGGDVQKIGWFDSAKSLRSGWALGQNYLKGATAVAHAKIGKGHLYLFGPEITFRAQPHATFRFLFNGIFLSAAGPEVTNG
jgi:hypothetical protein